MGYIEELRQVLGHRPIILVGAAVLVVDDRGRILMGFRSDNQSWGIPGGGMEPGETLEGTARREVREETGLSLGKLDLFGVFSGPDFYYVYPNGDQVYNVSIVYRCRDFHGDINQNDEHTCFRFFPPDELPDEISPPVRPVLRQWLASIQDTAP